MKEFLNEMARLWWIEVGNGLTNPLSEESLNGLRKILKEEYDFDSEVIEYIVESAVKTPSNFHLGGNRESGMQVGTNDTAVSAHLHHDGNDDEDGAIDYDEPLEEDEEDEKTDSEDENGDSEEDDKEKVDADIKQNALTTYEKEKLKENLLIELGQILSEASIYDNKYAVGDKFLPLKNTANLFKMGLPPSTRVPKGPFTKISSTDDGIEVVINAGARTVYVSSEDTGKNYIITASDKNIQSLFGKMKKGASATDVNFDTDTMETAACMGLYINGVGILQQLMGAKEEDLGKVTQYAKDKFIKALGSSGDFAKADAILSKLDSMPLGDYFLIAQLAAGMTKFTQGVLPFKTPYLIHKNIKGYYSATERSELVDGVKDNTADAVVCSVPGSELISKLNAGLPVEYDKKGVCTIKGTNIKFLQVSLKKGKGAAQLGKIYGFLKDKYGLLDSADVKKLALESVQLDEGLRDFLNKGVSFIKSLGSKLLEKISQLGTFLGGFLKKMEKGFKKSPKSDVKRLEKELFKAGLHEGILNEAKKPKIWDSFEAIAKDQTILNKLVENVNKEMGSLMKASMANPAFFFKGYSKLALTAPVTKDDVAKLLTNFQSAIVLKSILGDLTGDAKSLYSQLVELEKEMVYGKTTLPLYKVFGLDKSGGGTPYEAYPGSETFIQNKLAKDLSDTVVFYLRANSQTKYFTIAGYGLSGINETTGDLKYSQFRMGTNSTGRYSYNFEGTQEMTLGKVKSALKI
tara:strand:- start:1086 stop:3323 length:2238 start_codon:yes stop_codon:yes gene_type:complete